MASRRRARKPIQDVVAVAPPLATAADPALGRAVWLRVAILVIAGALAYANALSGPFVLDDQDTIVMNEQIRQLSPSVVLFPALELPVAGRPVVNLAFALNYAVGGLNVVGYHIVNVAIHIACALLLFGVVRRTLVLPSLRRWSGSRATDLAFAAALLWLVHPLHTDAVDYVTQRTELMLGFFYLLTFYASLRAYEQERWWIVAVVACALGMGSKESMVTAPFLILVYDRIFVFDTFSDAWRQRSRLYIPLAATWLVLIALIWSGPRFRSAGFSTNVTPWTYLLNQTEMIVRYVRLTLWPRDLVVDYGVPRTLTLGDVAPYAALVLVLAALTIRALARAPKIGFLGVWFFTTLSPTSSIVPIATEVGAERRMYLPLAAIAVLVVVGAVWLWDRFVSVKVPSRGQAPAISESESSSAVYAAYAALALVALGLLVGTVVRNRDYASATALARTTVARWPSARARHSLGIALVADDRSEEGISELRAATAGDPGAEYTLGVVLFKQGKLDEALMHLRTFLANDSTRIEVPTAHELVGRALRTQGHYAEAAGEFRTVLMMTPANAEMHGLLAELLLRQQQFEEAVPEYQQFLAYRPRDISAQMQLGIAFVALGRQDDAIVQFRRVVELNPEDGGAHRNLARAFIEKGAYAEAIPAAGRAVALRPDDAVAHDQLGIALAGLGRLDEGIAEIRRALQLDPNDNEVRGHLQAALAAKAAAGRRP